HRERERVRRAGAERGALRGAERGAVCRALRGAERRAFFRALCGSERGAERSPFYAAIAERSACREHPAPARDHPRDHDEVEAPSRADEQREEEAAQAELRILGAPG